MVYFPDVIWNVQMMFAIRIFRFGDVHDTESIILDVFDSVSR